MKFEYNPKGTCSKKMVFEIENEVIKEVEIIGGCPGNLKGISRIIKDMNINDVIEDFEGVTCGMKSTSCPDQIAQALKQYKENA